MEVRVLRNEEVKIASGLCRYVFDSCLRERMEYPQTIGYVEEYIAENNLFHLVAESKLILWGAFEGEQMVGAAGIQSDGMITILYVLPQCQNKGYGSQLLKVMRDYAKNICGFRKVTVNANPAWTSFFFSKKGFSNLNDSQDLKAPFIPMYAFADSVDRYEKRKVSKKWIILAVISCFLFATIVGSLFMIWYLF